MATVADQAIETEDRRELPPGEGERYAGYAIMGLPFRSGHVLAMRRSPTSSIGPGYTSVWHRDPAGAWEIWQNQPVEMGCARYFSSALADTRTIDIDLAWTQPSTVRLAVRELDFEWTTTLRSSAVTTSLSAVAGIVPDRLWSAQPVLSMIGWTAGKALRAGRVGLAGRVPNGQHFVANPLRVWLVADAEASLRGVDFGQIGELDTQASLGEFWIPQRGVFAIGRSSFNDADVGTV